MQAFADGLWGKGDAFDNCGMYKDGNAILPSFHYKDSSEFLNAFKPPYFSNYSISIIEGTTGCFTTNDVQRLALSLLSVAIVALATALNAH